MSMDLALGLLARAGGGGSSGGGGAAGIIVIPLLIASYIGTKIYRRNKIKRAKQDLAQAKATDSSWSDTEIKQRVSQVFYEFQRDWSAFDTGRMRYYLTPRYHGHIALMMYVLYKMGRRNEMSSVKIHSIEFIQIQDRPGTELDRFSVEIKASSLDTLAELSTGKTLKYTSEIFTEVWHFEKDNGVWMLDGISQLNKSGFITTYDPKTSTVYQDFARKNNFYYNADFGWLLMPLRGILFGSADFGRSDINHHVLGIYRNVVVQFFEYQPFVGRTTYKDYFSSLYRKRKDYAVYSVAHTPLPKDYGNIIVERRKTGSLFNFTPLGMHKVTLEWPEFNKRFNVYAKDLDRVPSLELLNPAYMEKLAALPYRVGLEIIGNDLYIYSTDGVKIDYDQMLQLLQSAFAEIKM